MMIRNLQCATTKRAVRYRTGKTVRQRRAVFGHCFAESLETKELTSTSPVDPRRDPLQIPGDRRGNPPEIPGD